MNETDTNKGEKNQHLKCTTTSFFGVISFFITKQNAVTENTATVQS